MLDLDSSPYEANSNPSNVKTLLNLAKEPDTNFEVFLFVCLF